MQSDPSELLDALFIEAKRILKEMASTKDLETRKIQSETLKNLCDSIGVFFDAMSDIMSASSLMDFDDDDGDDDDEDDDDDDDD